MSSIRRILIFLTLLAPSIPALSQDDPKELAKNLFDVAEEILTSTQALDQARDMYTQAADLDTTFIKANYEAGHIRIRTIDKGNAKTYFMRVYRQDPDFRFDILYWIGKSYQFGLDFDNALRYYNLYKDKLKSKSNYQGKDKTDLATVDKSILECENGKKYVANPGNFSIVNIGREINSDYDDYGPVFSEKGDEIVFTSRRKDDNLNQNVFEDNLPYEDIYTAKKSGPNWAFAANMGNTVNTLYHESSLAMSADGSLLFIYNDVNGGDILTCERKPDGTWGAPVPLPGIINSSFEEKSISISKDENTLYFTSNRPGGYGKTDIYKATKDAKGHWSSVKNLGPKINTAENEDGPFIDYDNETLYFSSNGLQGMGGYDIYKTKWDKAANDWADPQNLGYPINTPDDDVYIVTSPDSKTAYYSSVRDDGLGYTDIYVITAKQAIRDTQPLAAKDPEPEPRKPDPVVEQPKADTTATVVVKKDPPKEEPKKTEPKKTEPKKVEPKKELVPLKYVVKVIDAGSKTPMSAKIKLAGAKDNVIVASTSPEPGVYEFKITNATAKDYRLSIEVDGYVFQNQNVKINGAGTEEKTLNRTIEMRKIAVGVVSILRNIYFDSDKATFKTDSYSELNKLEGMLRSNSSMQVEISGHTDSYGPTEYNKQLSQRRAEAVKDFLTKKGIDARRVKAVGYGESKPLASNDDEDEGREINRRVEFKVLQN